MRSLNIDQLKALAMVVETGGFTAAARRLHLTQSAVSMQIRELEERLGVQLVERLGKRAFATAAGREVLEHAEFVFRRSDEIVAATRRHREGWIGRVRLGTGPSILAYLLPPILKALREEQPKLELALRSGITRDLIALVLTNELDLAVVTMPVEAKGLAVTPLREDAMVAVLPGSEADAPAPITPQELARWPLILDGRSQADRSVRQWLREGGVEPKSAMECGSPEAIRNVVAAGMGASVLGPEVFSRMDRQPVDVVLRPLDPPLIRTMALIQRRDKPGSPALELVREALMGMRQTVADAEPENRKRRSGRRSRG